VGMLALFTGVTLRLEDLESPGGKEEGYHHLVPGKGAEGRLRFPRHEHHKGKARRY